MRKNNILKRCLLMLTSIAIMVLSYQDAEAATKVLSVSRVKQDKSNWCWAAASEMVGGYKVSGAPTQWQVVELIFGNAYPNVGGSVDNMVSGVQYVSKYTKKAYVSSFSSLPSLQSEINAGKPMIIRMGWNAGGGHAIVGAGYSDSSIYAIDPWENTSNRYYAYTLLKNGGTIATGTGKATHAVLY